MNDLGKTVKYVELDNKGNIKRLAGVCKAKDFQKKDDDVFVDADKLKPYWDQDVFKELGIRRID